MSFFFKSCIENHKVSLSAKWSAMLSLCKSHSWAKYFTLCSEVSGQEPGIDLTSMQDIYWYSLIIIDEAQGQEGWTLAKLFLTCDQASFIRRSVKEKQRKTSRSVGGQSNFLKKECLIAG